MTVTTPSLVRPFLDAAPAAVRPALEAIADLDRRLWAIVAEGRAAWPQLGLDARHVVEFIARQATDELADAGLDGLRPADLYLAWRPPVPHSMRSASTGFTDDARWAGK